MFCFNAVVFGFVGRDKILENLVSDGLINVVFRFVYEPKKDSNTVYINDLIFDSLDTHNIEYDIPIALFEKIQKKTFLRFMANMGRHDSYRGGHSGYAAAVYLFRRIVTYLYNMLVKNRVSLVLMALMPHEIVDVLCEDLAHMMGIKVVLCVTPSYQADGFFCIDNSLDYGKFKNKPLQREVLPQPVDAFIRNSNTRIKNSEWVKWNNNFSHSFLTLQVHHGVYPLENLKDYLVYRKNICTLSSMYSFPKNFIYFPLHYQPEASTIAFSDILWDDQVTCIEYLAQKLPDSYIIIIKEQPSQSFYYRNQTFFNRLKELPQVRFAARDANSHDIIKQSRCVATVTGTAGWEALKFGKPVIYFGNPTYREMPGAFAFSQELNIEEVVRYEVKQQDLELAMGQLLATLYPGALGEERCKSEEENWNICTASLSKILTELATGEPDYIEKNNAAMDILQQSTCCRGWIAPEGLASLPLVPEGLSSVSRWKRAVLRGLRLAEELTARLLLPK